MAPSMARELLGGLGVVGEAVGLWWLGGVWVCGWRGEVGGYSGRAPAACRRRGLPIPVQESDAGKSSDHDEDNQIGSRCGEDGRRP